MGVEFGRRRGQVGFQQAPLRQAGERLGQRRGVGVVQAFGQSGDGRLRGLQGQQRAPGRRAVEQAKNPRQFAVQRLVLRGQGVVEPGHDGGGMFVAGLRRPGPGQ